jgi:hypothetical protein
VVSVLEGGYSLKPPLTSSDSASTSSSATTRHQASKHKLPSPVVADPSMASLQLNLGGSTHSSDQDTCSVHSGGSAGPPQLQQGQWSKFGSSPEDGGLVKA